MANVTMRDIAEKLGVSIVSVSKALTGKEGVSEELREKVKRKRDLKPESTITVGMFCFHCVKTYGRISEMTYHFKLDTFFS